MKERTNENDSMLLAQTAINALFEDRSYTPQEVANNLKELIGEIEILIDALESGG